MEILSEVQAGIKDEIALICTLVKKKKLAFTSAMSRCLEGKFGIITGGSRGTSKVQHCLLSLFFFFFGYYRRLGVSFALS